MTPDSPASARVEPLARPPAEADLAALAALLVEAVEEGAAVSFRPPLDHAEALAWWRATLDALPARGVVLVARDGTGIVGTVQAIPAWAPNQPDRADVAKLIVHRRARGRGIAAALMRRLEEEMRARGIRLLTLDTKRGDAAERLYRRLGWTEVGTIPRFAYDPDGAPHDATIFFRELREEPAARPAEAAVRVRPAAPGDAAEWLRMRCALWPEAAEGIPEEEHAREIAAFFAGDRAATHPGPHEVLVAERVGDSAATGAATAGAATAGAATAGTATAGTATAGAAADGVVRLGGLVELSMRPYAEGCATSPVAYLEGWWVDPDLRRRGVGRALVRAAEAWARGAGITEFASDALIGNAVSHAAHRALGFVEVERIACYRRDL